MTPTDDRDDEAETFLPAREPLEPGAKNHAPRRAAYLRLVVECVMAIAIVVLLLRQPPASCAWSSEKYPVPQCESRGGTSRASSRS
jgi:hypothetical protein